MTAWTVRAAALGLALTGALPRGADPEKGRAIFEEGCASCHFIPDRAIHRDLLWVRMIDTTA
ncbi:MAG: hypothetical protein HY722_07185 [Planctomycetes bacterium]|nr:hypothetical protein [Planctomycetota bacterium]